MAKPDQPKSPPRADGKSGAAPSPPPSPAAAAAALRAFSEGRLDDFHGLDPACPIAVADAALGSVLGEGTGDLGGAATPYRDYAATSFAPHGVKVWHRNGRVVLALIVAPVWSAAAAARLGPPEGRAPSRIAALHQQEIHARRGLSLHVPIGGGPVKHIYAFAPMSLEQFMASPISRLEIRRIRLR